jgi:hypothetical protein
MGMVLGIGRRNAQDAGSRQAPAPYKLASYDQDVEGRRFKSSNVVYSFWSAAKYTLILSLVLWWLPLFGQMIAGYVGGRRAGGPWKGVAAAIVPVICLYFVMTGFETGFLPSHIMGVAIAPAAIGASLSANLPFLAPYLEFSSEYVGAFVSALAGSSPYGINTYVVTVAFAYVGGILAEQSRREIEFTSGAVMSNTTVLVADGAYGNNLPSYPPHHTHNGLAHSIASRLPWYGDHQQPVHALPPVRGGWENAVSASLDDEEDVTDQVAVVPRGVTPARAASHARSRKNDGARKTQHRGQRKDPWEMADRRVRKQRRSQPKRSHSTAVEEMTMEAPRMPTASAGRMRKSSTRSGHLQNNAASRRRTRRMESDWNGPTRRSRGYSRSRVPLEDPDDEVDLYHGPSVPRRSAARQEPGQKWDSI